MIGQEPWRIRNLRENTIFLKSKLFNAGFDLWPTQTPIIPVMCRETEKTVYLARHRQRNGVFIRAIYHPTVPKGKARLRASVLSCHSTGDLEYCARTIINGAKELRII